MLGNIQQIFQTLGNVFVNAVFVKMLTTFTESAETIYTQRSFSITVFIFCAIMVVSALITLLFTKERVTDAALEEGKKEVSKGNTAENIKSLLKNKYWLMLLVGNFVIFFVVIFNAVGGIFYSQYVFGNPESYAWLSNSTSIAQFAIMLITPMVMKKVPKHVIYTIGMGVMAAGYLGFALWGTTQIAMIVFNALKGIGLGISGAMALGMIADSIEYGRLKTGIDAIGMGNAGMSAAQKLGLGLGTAVFGWILDGAGFDGALDLQGIAQPGSVKTAIQFVYNWIPLVVILFIFLMMLFLYRNVEKDIEALRKQSK